MSTATKLREATRTPLAATPVFVPVLDSVVTAPHAAFSLQQLKTTSTKCVRIRRSTDAAELDIGFAPRINGVGSSGLFDSAAVSAFVGGGNGYITKWYDQSGNGRDSVVPATGAQHRIALAGVVDTLGGFATAYAEDANRGYTYTFGSTTSNIVAGFCVAAQPNVAATASYMGFVNNASPGSIFTTGGASIIEKNGAAAGATGGYINRIGNSTRVTTGTGHATDILHQMYSEFSGTAPRMIINGTETAPGTSVTSTVTTTAGAFGGQTQTGTITWRSTNVRYCEFIFYLASKPTAQDVIDITARQKAHYGTP